MYSVCEIDVNIWIYKYIKWCTWDFAADEALLHNIEVVFFRACPKIQSLVADDTYKKTIIKGDQINFKYQLFEC